MTWAALVTTVSGPVVITGAIVGRIAGAMGAPLRAIKIGTLARWPVTRSTDRTLSSIYVVCPPGVTLAVARATSSSGT